MALCPRNTKMQVEKAADIMAGKEHGRPASKPNCLDVVG